MIVQYFVVYLVRYLLLIRLIWPSRLRDCLWTWVMAALLLPVTITFLGVAHASLFLGAGSKEDPLGYGVIALKG